MREPVIPKGTLYEPLGPTKIKSTGWLRIDGTFNTVLGTSCRYRTNTYSKLHSIMGNIAEYNTNQ